MSASYVTENNADLRRWASSAAFVLLMHGAIAVAVLTWSKLISPPNLSGPVMIDLAPLPAAGGLQSEFQLAPAGEQGQRLPPTPEQFGISGGAGEPIGRAEDVTEQRIATKGGEMAEPAAERVERAQTPEQLGTNSGPGEPTERAAENPEQRAAAKADEGAQLAETQPGMAAPTALVPAENGEGQNAADSGAVSGGVAKAMPGGGSGAGEAEDALPGGGSSRGAVEGWADAPIDTNMSAHSGLPSKKAGATARKPIVLIRPSKSAAQHGHLRDLSAASGAATDAIGAHVQDHARAASAQGGGPRTGIRNALGGTATNMSGGMMRSAAGAAATNSIGVTARFRPRIGEQRSGALALAAHALPSAAIDGTSVRRTVPAAGVIGGQAKNVAGVLNGTGFSLRHP